MVKERDVDDYRQILGEAPGVRYESVVTPRIILMTPKGLVLLHQYKETGWWGLIGGKVQKRERQAAEKMTHDPDGGELIKWGRTLRREGLEESGVKLSPDKLRYKTELIAHTKVTLLGQDPLDPTIRVAREAYTPMYWSYFDPGDYIPTPQNILVPISGPMPGPLFPDASEGLQFIRTLLNTHWDSSPRASRHINMRLGPEEGYFFRMKGEEMGLQMGPPPWLVQMKKMSGNVY